MESVANGAWPSTWAILLSVTPSAGLIEIHRARGVHETHVVTATHKAAPEGNAYVKFANA